MKSRCIMFCKCIFFVADVDVFRLCKTIVREIYLIISLHIACIKLRGSSALHPQGTITDPQSFTLPTPTENEYETTSQSAMRSNVTTAKLRQYTVT
jgi:hypothetical protein